MRTLTGLLLAGGLLFAVTIASAQRPGGGRPEPGPNEEGNAPTTASADAEDLVTRMMAFDADKDGKLARAEITDDRLIRLFDRADADKDGSVTRGELSALATREHAEDRGGFGGPGGPGGPPGGGPMMAFPKLGEVFLPPPLQQRLKLTAEQKAQLTALQHEVEDKLAKILDAEQRTILRRMQQYRPGGPEGFPGPGGPPGESPGGRRGRPPGEGGPPPPPDGPPED